MPFQPVPDGVEVVFNGVQNGVPVVNVYNIRDTSTHTEARLQEIIDTMYEWWVDHMSPLQHTSYVLQSIKATNLTSSAGPQVIQSYTTANTGSMTGGESAGNGAAVISWRTENIGRSFRGRTYVGGIGVNALANAQTLGTTYQADLVSAGTSLLDALEAISATLCVLSRFAAGVARVAGLLTQIISVVVDAKVDSQRRRTAN